MYTCLGWDIMDRNARKDRALYQLERLFWSCLNFRSLNDTGYSRSVLLSPQLAAYCLVLLAQTEIMMAPAGQSLPMKTNPCTAAHSAPPIVFNDSLSHL